MKVIDMLDRIAKGEKLHFYVINNDFKKIAEYFYEKGKPLRYDDGEDVEWRISEDWLNCEVEIVEEDKKIKKLESYISCGWNGTCKDLKRDDLYNDLKKIGNKINEIIDKLNEMEKE